jgi:hypothetical protein
VSRRGIPWRGPGPERPDLPLPPAKVPLRRRGRWRKRWRYLGVFSDELLLCAARVGVGPLGQTFWAVWDRDSARMVERTRMLGPIARGEVWTEVASGEDTGRLDWVPGADPALVRIEAVERGGEEPVRAFLRVGAAEWVESVCPTGDGEGYVWTRKRVAPVECDVRLGERRIHLEARGIEDESCGFHPRHTVWDWSAGIGALTDGRAAAWNLVSGINDPPERSERAIWIDGAVSEPAPVRFEGLDAIELDGGRLEFSARCERRKEERRAFIRYSYRQPFGSFAGTLPGGLELAEGFGVMEHHDARW